MEILYQPFFGGHCFYRIFVIAAGIAAIGLLITMLFWFISRSRAQIRPYVAAPFGIGLLIGVALAAYIPFSSRESMVMVSTDWNVLEHRFCLGTRLEIRTHNLADVVEKKYRRQVRIDRDSGRKRISHYLDIFVKSRMEPISISLDALDSEVDLAAVERLAPVAVARYRKQR